MEASKQMNNLQIAELLRAVAAAYKIKDERANKFRIVSYERAADAVEKLSSEAKDLWDAGELEEIGGIGKSIAEHLGEIFKSGKSKHFEAVLKGIDSAVFELLKVPGIGPKNAVKLVHALGISGERQAIQQLKKAAGEGSIAKLEGFGQDSEKAILTAISEYKGRKNNRMLLSRAEEISEPFIKWMSRDTNVVSIDVLGSQRRRASTVGDIDLAAASRDSVKTIEHFVNYPNKSRVLEKGDRTASVILPGSIQVDLMVAEPGSYGALLQHFTGSKQHNILLREVALRKKWSLSDYGIKIGGELHKFATEEEIYRKLGMQFIPPELREGTDEIEAGIEGGLPKLVELKDIKGDLQMHSSYDIETSHDIGGNSMEEMIAKASALGYEYLAFTEHNPAQKGHDSQQIANILKGKADKIEQINDSLKKSKESPVKKVFNSLEIDILPDGDLPVDSHGLELLDFALVSIHSSFKQSRQLMTKRVLRALSHPKVKIFAHPTARKLREREGVELDWDSIFDFCLRNNKWIEINAEPSRLDLPDFLVKEAIKAGVKLTLGTDAHNIDGMDNMKYGVYVARRGWAEKGDIVNSLSLSKLEKML